MWMMDHDDDNDENDDDNDIMFYFWDGNHVTKGDFQWIINLVGNQYI